MMSSVALWFWLLILLVHAAAAEQWMDEFSVETIEGRVVPFNQYATFSAILIVNVASECGYTDSNYRELQQLYERFHDSGLEILAFPCNQFGAQEPHSHAKIQSFVQENYDVSFPLMAKVDVNGPDAHPLFAYLKEKLPGSVTNDIKWNFTKFLILNGLPFKRYSTLVDPMDEIADDIEAHFRKYDEL